MASKYKQVGVIWKGKEDKNGFQMCDTFKFNEDFTPNPDCWYQVQTKDFKLRDLERKIQNGWVSEEQAEKIRYVISKMSDQVRAEIYEVAKDA